MRFTSSGSTRCAAARECVQDPLTLHCRLGPRCRPLAPDAQPAAARALGITVAEAHYFRYGNTVTKTVPAPLTPAVFHILLALAEGPLHGYAIMQAVEATAGVNPPMGPG